MLEAAESTTAACAEPTAKRRRVREDEPRTFVRRVLNTTNADAMLAIPSRENKPEETIMIHLPRNGRALTLGRPHAPNALSEELFIPVCDESNRKISRKLASLHRATSRRLCLVRNRNTVTSIVVDGVLYGAGERASLEAPVTTIRFGTTAQKEYEVHAYLVLPSTDDFCSYFDVPQYDAADFASDDLLASGTESFASFTTCGSFADLRAAASSSSASLPPTSPPADAPNFGTRTVPSLKTLAARAAFQGHARWATAAEKRELQALDARKFAADEALAEGKEELRAAAAALSDERAALATRLRRKKVAAEVRARWVANSGIEPSDADLNAAVDFQANLDDCSALVTKTGHQRGELGVVPCPCCASPLTPVGRLVGGAVKPRKKRRSAPLLRDDDDDVDDDLTRGGSSDSDDDLLYVCSQPENPFAQLCGGVKVDLVCDMNHDCALKGMRFRGTHLKLCHSTEMRLVLGEGYSRRLVSKEGDLPSGYCDVERHLYKPGICDAVFVRPKQLLADGAGHACKTCPAQAGALFCHTCVETRPRRREGLFCAKCHSGPACCLAADRYRYRHLDSRGHLDRPHRSKDERRAHLSPCGLCGALYCRSCIHESRICCNDCYATDFALLGAGHESNSDDGDDDDDGDY